jgi:hypothetical protein
VEIGAFQNKEIMDNLLFYYRYDSPFVNDGVSANVYDVTNNKLNAVMSGGVSKVATNGGGMAYNGTDGVVLTSVLTINIQSFTYECWLKPNVLGTRKTLIVSDQTNGATGTFPLFIEINSTNKFRAIFGDNTKYNLYESLQTLVNTNIVHIAYTRWNDIKKQEFVVNGISGGIVNWTDLTCNSNTVSPVGKSISLGRTYVPSTALPLDGIIYSSKLYTVPLTAEQVKQNYNATKNRFEL